jgi:twinkle protein
MEKRMICPKCSEGRSKSKQKCMAVNEEGLFYCHHCGFKGGANGSSKSFSQPDYERPSGLSKNILDAFVRRGISESIVMSMGIGYNGTEVMFPYYDWDGTVVNIKYRGPKKSFRTEKDAEMLMYNLQSAEADKVYIVEGEFDALSLKQCGIKSVLSVPSGVKPGQKMDWLTREEAYFEGVGKVVICVDSDEVGASTAEELSRRIGRHKCEIVDWSPYKDANEVLMAHGSQEVLDYLGTAKPVPVAGLFKLEDFKERLDHLKEHGAQGGVSTGWSKLDEHWLVSEQGELTVVTGIPGSGKSNFVDALFVNLAEHQGWSMGIYSPENQPLERHAQGLVEKYTAKSFWKGDGVGIPQPIYDEGVEFVGKYFNWILPKDDHTLKNILDLARTLVYRDGIKALVLDPYNDIDHSRKSNQSETEYISTFLTQLRQFARDNSVHVFLVAHPTKLKKLDDGTYPIPTPYDIAGSAHFRGRADNCISVHRVDQTGRGGNTEVHIQKVRFSENTPSGLGFTNFSYDWKTARFL